MPRCFAGMMVLLVLTMESSLVAAQSYPTRPIRIVTSEVGGGNDFTARIIAVGIASRLGQPLIVDNRTTGLVPAEIVSKATPDGHTLLVTTNVLWILPLMQSTPYDAVKDFAPVTFTNVVTAVLAVHPSLSISFVKELIALAKAKPGSLNYASSGSGTASHLSGELFKSLAGVNIVRVPYGGAGLALNDAITGQVQLSFFTPAAVMAHVKSGRLKALAVTSVKPSALFPGLPTVASSLPGFETGSICGVYAPAGTPVAIIKHLNQELVRFLQAPETRERFLNAGSEVAAGPPERVAVAMKSEINRMGKLIKDAGIRQN